MERLTGEAGGDDAGEVGAFEDVFVRAAQRVNDGLAGGLGLGDLVIELGELAPNEPPQSSSATACDAMNALRSASENPTSPSSRMIPTSPTADSG